MGIIVPHIKLQSIPVHIYCKMHAGLFSAQAFISKGTGTDSFVLLADDILIAHSESQSEDALLRSRALCRHTNNNSVQRCKAYGSGQIM